MKLNLPRSLENKLHNKLHVARAAAELMGVQELRVARGEERVDLVVAGAERIVNQRFENARLSQREVAVIENVQSLNSQLQREALGEVDVLGEAHIPDIYAG